VRTPEECAAYMHSRYGKDASIHCMYAIMNNHDNKFALAYWKSVDRELDRLKKLDRLKDGERR